MKRLLSISIVMYSLITSSDSKAQAYTPSVDFVHPGAANTWLM